MRRDERVIDPAAPDLSFLMMMMMMLDNHDGEIFFLKWPTPPFGSSLTAYILTLSIFLSPSPFFMLNATLMNCDFGKERVKVKFSSRCHLLSFI